MTNQIQASAVQIWRLRLAVVGVPVGLLSCNDAPEAESEVNSDTGDELLEFRSLANGVLCCPATSGADPDDDDCAVYSGACPATLFPTDVLCLSCPGHDGWIHTGVTLRQGFYCDGLAINLDDDYSILDNDCSVELTYPCEACPQSGGFYKCNGVSNPDQDCQVWSTGEIEGNQYQPLCCGGLFSPTLCFPPGENTGACPVNYDLYTCEAMSFESEVCPGWRLFAGVNQPLEERAYHYCGEVRA
jgi:hypothetical protein